MKTLKSADELYNVLKPESAKSAADAFTRQYQPLTQENVTAARQATAQNAVLSAADAFTRDYLNQKNGTGGTSGKKAPWEDTVILERNTTGNRTLDMFNAHEANEARKKALAELQNQTAVQTPVQTSVNPASTAPSNTEAVGGKEQKNTFQSFLDTINYANARGGQALDAFINNLNVLGEQAYSAITAAAGASKTTSGGQTVLPSVFGNNKPVLTSSTNENGSLKTPEQINETAGASQGTAGQVKNAVREANTAVLEKAVKENRNARVRAEVDEAYPVSGNPVAKALGDLVATVSGQAPNIAVSAATGPLGGAALRGLTSGVDAYIEARQEGASVSQAKKYASREAVNQGIGDVLLTGIAGTGSGVLGKFAATSRARYALAKMYGTLVTSPAAKTAIKYVGNMLGEDVEEMLQNVWTVANKRLSYNDRAKVDPKEMLYEGVLGALTAGVFGSVNIPANYQVYKSDVDTVNAFSKAAAGVTSEAEANAVTEHGYEMINICNQIIADPDSDFDTKARFEYIKGGVQTTINEMGSNSQSIIESNVAFDEAVDDAADAPFDDPIYAAANIVTVVGENAEPGEDVIKTTIDRLNDEARAAYNQETNLRVTDEFRRQWEIRRRMLTALADIIRNRKTEVKQAVAGLLAAPQTNTDVQTAPNALTSGENSAIINTGNPVMQADGESLLPAAQAPAQEGGNKYDVTHREHINTKTNEPQHLFTIGQNLSNDDYAALKKAMKEVGGYWSKFAKGFIVPDDGVPKLADALGKIGVGIDESAYTPAATTASAETAAQTPSSGPLPEIEVLGNEEKGAETEVKDQEKRPQFEVYPGGGDVVPVDSQTAVTGADTETEISTEGPDVRTNTASEGDTAANPAENVTLPGTETPKAPKVTVNEPKAEKAPAEQATPAWTPESTERLTAENFPYQPGDTFKRAGTAETWTLKDRDDGMIRFDTGHYIDFNTEYGTFEKWLRSGDFTPAGTTNETAKPERGPVAPTPKEKPTSYPTVQDSVFYLTPEQSYRKGDQVKLEDGKTFTIDSITGKGLLSTVHLSELGQLYPVERAESMESFARLLRRFPQNEAKTEQKKAEEKPAEKQEPSAKSPEQEKTEVTKPEEKPAAEAKPYEKIADWVAVRLDRELSVDKKDLQIVANDAYGGTMAEGAYDVKDMGDALELGVNRHIIRDVSENLGEYTGNARTAKATLDDIDEFILRRIPTQTNRTDEQIKLQQFSTPPNIAYLANWIANITPSDTVLEPSAGIGGLASFAKGMGAKTVVNELSDRRLSLLKTLPFDGFYQENAEQIDNILPDSVKPTVVVMNPPFSANGRTKNKTANAIPHIEQALERLEDGGRLVAILGGGRDEGGGMSDGAPAFKSWWNNLRKDYSIRANIGIDGSNYSKYGTSFNVRLVVIDKTGPQQGETFVKDYKTLSEIPADLERIRNDRSHESGTRSTESERDEAVKGSSRAPESGTGSGEESTARPGKRDSDRGQATGNGSDRAGQQPVSDLSPEGNAESDRGADVVAEKPGAAVSPDDGKPESGRRGESGEAGGSAGDHTEQGSGRVGPRDAGDGTDRKPDELVRPEAGIPGAPAGVIKDTKRAPKKQSENDDGVYASYQPAHLTVKGAQKHPAKLVESSAMSAVSSPALTYVPTLDPKKMQDGTWSDAQLENISYAGQAHQEKLPNGQRKGYFIGDGTGVGKGRQLAGIIMDNFNQGRRRAIWISENVDLMKDAQRDWKDIGGDPKDIFPFSDLKKKGGAPQNGIMFVPYTTLPSESKKTKTDNLTLIENWFGKDFDGVILYDEAHNMGNLTPVKGKRGKSKPAAKAVAGNKLQNDLPNARVVYASATGATKIENLSYAARLGLWGEKTAFRDVNDFVSKIGSAGISAMELVARDMKAMGVYLARSISFDGVVYDNLDHKLTKPQIAMYDRMSDGWQTVLQNFDRAMELTDSSDAKAVKQARSQIYGNMQLFYSQVLTSFSTPSVIKNIEEELQKGHSCVIQLVNTQESATVDEIQRVKEEGLSLDNVDVTPRKLLVGYVERYFPVTQYESYIDDDGNEQSRPVLDSQGNPVINKKAQQMKEDLIADLNEISIPEGPLDMIVNHFGTDQVAEITGRSQRVVNVTDENGNVQKKVEKRDPGKAKVAETEAFQNGDKRILIFSQAGSTGRSFHADKRAKNQQKRIHYVLQAGWIADKAVQGFGRTNRSNQVDAPIYRLVRTDVEGHKRFVTSIARRLDQLGALTKGQRQTGSGIFGEKDNLESPLSTEALKSFYRKLGNGYYPEFNAEEILGKMGLAEKFYDEWGNFKADAMVAGEITTFLNRILSLHVSEQNELFKLFEAERDAFYNAAIESGTLDTGLENVRADKIEIEQEDVVYTDPKTGAETKYVKAKLFNKPKVITTVDAAQNERPGFTGIYRMKDGSVRAAYRIADSTDAMTGEVVKKFVLIGPNQGKASRYLEATLKSTCEEVPKKEWQSAWDEEVQRVPEYNEGEAHMITGALLPIWDKLPQGGNVKARRLIASDGTQYLGRVIEKSLIDSVLRGLNVNVKKVKYTGADLYKAVMNDGKTVTLNGSYGSVYTIGRRRVAGENRIEITGPNMYDIRMSYPDLITETIQYSRRYFIPTGKKGEKMLGELADRYGVRSLDAEENTGDQYSAGLARGKWGKGNRDKSAQVRSINDLVDEAVRIFGIPIHTGRMGGVRKTVQGVFKSHPETIRTRTYGDLPTIAHEIGHWFDKKYNLHSNNFIGTLTAEFGDDLRMAGYADAQIPYESVAEYFRVYLSDKEDAAKRFRDFTDALLSTINQADSKRLEEYSDMTNAYFAADLDRRASAQVHYRTEDSSVQQHAQVVAEQMKRNPWEYLGNASRDYIRNWRDDLVDLRGFGNTYDLAYYEKQARSIAYGRLTSAFTDKNGNVVGRSLADVLSDGKIDERNARTFDEYLIARRALDQIEAAERGEDVGTLVYADEELQDADKIAERIDRYERENPTFRSTAEGVYAYERNLLDLAVNSGLMSEELRDRLNELYPHYVPLYRVMDDKDQKTRGAKRGYADQNTPIARFKGSGRDIYSPIESIIQNTEKFTASCMRNDVMMEFADFIDQNEGLGWAAEKIPQAKILDYISTDELGKQIAQFAMETDRLDAMSEKERSEFFASLMSYIGDTLSQWKPAAKQGKRVVSVLRNGQRSYYEVHDEGLYKALTNMDAPQFDLVTKFFGSITRLNKFFYTTSNPQFVFTNPQRDLVTGFISSQTTNNPVRYVVDFSKAFIDVITNSEDYQAYLRSGGGYMGSVTADYNILKRVKRDVVKPNRSAIRKFMDTVAELCPRLTDATESAFRLADQKRAKALGYSNMEAMRMAQEVTVNFARGGRVVKQINQFIPFFQAGFAALSHDYDLFVNGDYGGGGRNGNTGFGRNLSPEAKARRRNAWLKWLLTTGMLALLTWLYNYVIAPKLTGETEENVKQSCDNLSNYNKNAFYNLYLGDDKFIRIKKTQDMSVLATIVERMMEYYVLDQKDALGGLADYCFDNILPINPFNGENALDGMLSMLGEVSGVGTAVDLARNKDFKGTPIVSTRYQYLPKEEQFKENTSQVWIALGNALHMSPIQLQYAAEDNFGWAARLVDNLTPYNGERSLGIRNKLITDSVYSTDIINNFYDQKDVYDKSSKAYKANPSSKKYSLEDVYGAYKYGKIADLYSDLNSRTRDEGDNDLSREMRAKTNALIQTVNDDKISVLDRAVIDIAESTGSEITDIAPYLVVPDHLTYKQGSVKVDLPMDYDDMVLYYTQSQIAFENVYGRIMEAGYDDSVTASLLAEARKEINKGLRDTWLNELVAREASGK